MGEGGKSDADCVFKRFLFFCRCQVGFARD